MKRIAIDIGNVLTDESPDHAKLFSSPDHLAIPHSEEAFRAVSVIVEHFASSDCFLISRCNKGNEAKIMEWLVRHDFFTCTNFKEQNVRFCRKREDKKEIAEALCITHFIDDRWSVLKHIEGVSSSQQSYLINPQKDELSAWLSSNSTKTIRCENWTELKNNLMPVNQ